jgi:hypothetical protein
MALLLIMLLADDVHGKHFIDTHVDSALMNVDKNSSSDIIPIYDAKNETNISSFADDRLLFIPFNEIINFYGMNL